MALFIAFGCFAAALNTFIDSIELYQDKDRKDDSPIKTVHYRFPVSYKGETVYDVMSPKETTDETCVLLSKIDTLKG